MIKTSLTWWLSYRATCKRCHMRYIVIVGLFGDITSNGNDDQGFLKVSGQKNNWSNTCICIADKINYQEF